jgi:hypothetical protein
VAEPVEPPVLHWSPSLAAVSSGGIRHPLDGLIYTVDGRLRVWHEGDRYGLHELPRDARRLVLDQPPAPRSEAIRARNV